MKSVLYLAFFLLTLSPSLFAAPAPRLFSDIRFGDTIEEANAQGYDLQPCKNLSAQEYCSEKRQPFLGVMSHFGVKTVGGRISEVRLIYTANPNLDLEISSRLFKRFKILYMRTAEGEEFDTFSKFGQLGKEGFKQEYLNFLNEALKNSKRLERLMLEDGSFQDGPITNLKEAIQRTKTGSRAVEHHWINTGKSTLGMIKFVILKLDIADVLEKTDEADY